MALVKLTKKELESLTSALDDLLEQMYEDIRKPSGLFETDEQLENYKDNYKDLSKIREKLGS